jgi:predicted alpha/beta-fold hydrolase
MVKNLFTGHFHTIVGNFLSFEKLDQPREQHIIDLLDGDQLVGFLYRGSSNIVVSLYHGLSGSADADYMHRTAKHFLALGHSVFLVNHRGVGQGAGLAKYPYHSGRAEDVSQVLGYLRQLLPGKKQITAGFSMSGNIILYLLSGQRGEHLPDGAITVNAPINLTSCSVSLGRGLNRIYDIRFVKRLRKYTDVNIPPWGYVIQIDELYTAPRSGFKDHHEYYRVCSAKEHVQNIRVPTYVLTAEDDPFIDVKDYREAKWPSSVNLKIHPQGGHMGYVSRVKNSLGTNCWLDEYMVASLNELIAKI